jgi:HAD superfamily hydrolase (TIGR01509 family)
MPITSLKKHRHAAYPYKMEVGHVSLRAIIFDLDGVLVDSEPLHLSAFRKALGTDGSKLTDELYTDRYLSLSDRDAFAAFHRDMKKPLSQDELAQFMNKKAEIFSALVQTEGLLPYPAVPELVMALAQRYPLAVASGARRNEVEFVLESAGIRSYFEALVSSDDVKNGKPDPESFLQSVELLNASGKRPTAIRPDECVVIEDSKANVVAAHQAGMKCVAVATSYPAFELSAADLVVPSIAALKISQVEDLFQAPAPLPLPSTHPN